MLILNPHRGVVRSLAFSPDGTQLASIGWPGERIHLTGLTAERESSWYRHDERVGFVAFTAAEPAGLAWSDSRGNVVVWDQERKNPRPLDSVRPYHGLPPRLAFSPDAQTLAASGVFWSASDLPIFARPRHGATLWHWQRAGVGTGFGSAVAHSSEVFALAFSPDGDTLALGGLNRHVTLYDTTNLRPITTLNHDRKVHFLAFCRGGRTLATGSPDGLVRLWDVDAREQRGGLRGPKKTMTALVCSPDGLTLATGSSDGVARFWDAETGRLLRAYNWEVGPIASLAFAPDGQRAAAGGNGQIIVWDVDDW